MKIKSILLSALVASTLLSCKKDDDNNDTQEGPSTQEQAVSTYSRIVEASYADAVSTAKDLQTAINNFVAAPSADGLETAKQAWIDCRVPYGQTEPYRFYDGPIDNAVDGPEGQINAWPLDENYIDYVDGDSDAGIINNSGYIITKANLVKTNADNVAEDDSGTFVVTGYHAIEFMLWGQDLTAPSVKESGQRSYTDYTTLTNYERRKDYLKFIAEILVDDLESIHDQWKDGADYRTSFESNTKVALFNILTGVGELAGPELGGERMRTAYDVAGISGGVEGQEDEHSCFADNTHNDIILNFKGCANIMKGSYTTVANETVSGTSLLDVIREFDAEKATMLEEQIDAAVSANDEIDNPFDDALDNDRADILKAIEALEAFELELVDARDNFK
jgi:putative iron-regulated protein